jgi:single-strand DNA-binding protein
MSDLNKVIVIGRLTRDIELKYTPAGTPVASFSIANNYSYKSGNEKKEQVSYFDCTAWSKSAEILEQYVKKGHKIAIEGRLTQRSWQDQDGKNRSKIEITVENFQFLEGKSSDSKPESKPDKVKENFGGDDVGNFEENPFSDSDIPF